MFNKESESVSKFHSLYVESGTVYYPGIRLDTSGNLAAVRILLAPYWCVLVAGPAAFLLSALHIILGYHFPRVGFILGSFVSFIIKLTYRNVLLEYSKVENIVH